MQHRHREHRKEDHRSFQDHKGYLVVGNGTVETLLELCHTIYRTDEDEQNGGAERILEPFEPFGAPQLDEAYLLGTLARPAQAEYELQPQCHKDEQRDDLEHDTRKHNAPPYVALGLVIGCRCNAAACALKDQGDKVARHEGDRIGARAEARDSLAVDNDYSGEAEVERTGEEGGADCEGDEIARACQVSSVEAGRDGGCRDGNWLT